MYLIIEDNPNCAGEERVFAESGRERIVTEVNLERPDGSSGWCTIVGMDSNHVQVPAVARQVEDSAAGVAWLITGGSWGLRLRPSESSGPWAVDDPTQWGRPFLVLDDNERDIRFV